MSITTPPKEEWPYVSVYGSDFRGCLKDMADTVTRLELWDWFRNESPPENMGYMYWGHDNVNKISSGLEDNRHSGATFGYAMRCMQAIAKDGFESWKNKMGQPE